MAFSTGNWQNSLDREDMQHGEDCNFLWSYITTYPSLDPCIIWIRRYSRYLVWYICRDSGKTSSRKRPRHHVRDVPCSDISFLGRCSRRKHEDNIIAHWSIYVCIIKIQNILCILQQNEWQFHFKNEYILATEWQVRLWMWRLSLVHSLDTSILHGFPLALPLSCRILDLNEKQWHITRITCRQRELCYLHRPVPCRQPEYIVLWHHPWPVYQ